ncbi:restriction endonuclease subunit S [Tenacibaculum dicentrarchi]|uniref:restriction endonuclease subunit S n=1 Tax=Tenacibaculum dicentrarchi TaxID=669041 RepID=UPI0035180568
MDNKKLIPNLRFPEFNNSWEEKKLGEIKIKIIDGDRGKNYPTGNDFSRNGYCLFLNAKNVTKKGFVFNETSFITKEKDSLLRKGKLNKEDIILTTRGSVGHISFYDENVIFNNIRINSGMIIIRNQTSIINNKYLYKYFNSIKIERYISKVSFGSAQPQLTVKEINSIPISYPELSEQEKIASFLTDVDSKLTQLTKKKALLENYKKGVMQKIFNQKIRFKDNKGNKFPNWKEKTLGEVSEITTGSSNRQDSELNGKYTFFDRSEDIRTSSRYLFNGEAIIVAGEGSDFKPKYFKGKFDLHQRTYAIMNLKKQNSKFMFFLIHFHRKYFLSQAVGSTVKSLRLPMFKKMPVLLPVIEEQEKIANFLSEIDIKIKTLNTKIENNKGFKKGLLQKMFV